MNPNPARSGWSRLVIYYFAMLLCLAPLAGCSTGARQHQIKAPNEVRIEDPNWRRWTDITTNMEIVATGEFTSGTFFINNALVSVQPDTRFHLNLSLPIQNPGFISTRNATGALWTSKEISFNTVPVPKVIELKKGVVSGQVSLARSVGAFFLNLIQVGTVSGDMKDMLNGMRIEEVLLDLRPGSTVRLGRKSIRIAENSTVRLTDAIVDGDMNYVGVVHMNLNFGSGCKWIGEKVDCEFDGGKLESEFVAKKFKNRLELSLPDRPEKNEPVILRNCTFRFGKLKRSSTSSDTCTGVVKEFAWQYVKGEDHPTMHLDSTMDLKGTHLKLRTDIHETTGYFPEKVPGKLLVNIKKDSRETHFDTLSRARAQDGRITFAKDTTKLVLTLGDVVIGPVSYDREGAFKFQLEGGVANLKQLDLRAKDSTFTLKCESGSTLSVPSEMLLEKADPKGTTHLKMPMKLKLGTATLQSRAGAVQLANLAGDIMVDVDKEIQLKSDLNFSLQELTILNGYQADVKAQGLDVSVHDGGMRLAIKHGRIVVPDEPLKEAIRKRVPESFELNLNKTIKQDKTWRYRNAVATRVKVDNLKVEDMRAAGPGQLAFTASGDVNLDGTVEKSGIVFNKNNWETKPWHLSGHVKGDGTVNYKFDKNAHSKDDQLQYDLSMELRMPEDITLDWSQVAHGILKVAERKVIVGKLKEVNFPFKHSGEISVLEKQAPAWRNLKLSEFVVKNAVDGGTEIDFVAETSTGD